MNKSSVVLFTMLLAVSCSKVEKFEDKTDSMESSTKEMSGTTKDMSETTKDMSTTTKEMAETTQKMSTITQQMAGTTEDMKTTTNVMYHQIRSKESEDTRSKKFTILDDKEKDIGAKLAAAAVYYKSFEFQLWTGIGEDTEEMREILLQDATNEFTRKVCDIHKHININKLNPTKLKNNDERAFFALATTMHYNHSFQENLAAKNSNIKLISFYDLTKEALLKDFNKEKLPGYEDILVSGSNKDMMIDLVKARVDFLAALALKNLTDQSRMTLGQKIRGLGFKISGGRIGEIDLPETYQLDNDPTKDFTVTYLDGALKARNFLKQIGINKKLEKTIRSAFENIDLSDEELTESEKAQDDLKDPKKKEIRGLINDLLSEEKA